MIKYEGSPEQILSQLLWDLEAIDARPENILKDFKKALSLEYIHDCPVMPLQPMLDRLGAALNCIVENPADMAEQYLELCSVESESWPYRTFLVALIRIMEENASIWQKSWRNLTQEKKNQKAELVKLHEENIKQLYSANIVEELRSIVYGRAKTMKDYYHLRWEREAFLQRDHFFINLKGVSSSSPIIYNNTFRMQLRGGGFYFRWNKFGVVVDPGLYFVTNMHEHGLSIYDIDAVVITHDHIDHNGDMMILDDLDYQIKSKEYATSTRIEWIVCKEVYDSSRIKEESKKLITPTQTIELNECVSLKAIGTRHIKKDSVSDNQLDPASQEGYLDSTFGCIFTLKEYTDSSGNHVHSRTIGYTSDTTYWDGMECDYQVADMLVANISSVRSLDIQMKTQHKYHLGYYGCAKILQQLDNKAPQMLLLSEFWNGLGDIRFAVSKQLHRMATQWNLDTMILPTEIGMEIDLATLGVKCSCCGVYSRTVSLIKPEHEFGVMRYVCENCIL